MTASVGDIYIHKDIGDTYLVTDVFKSRYGTIGCINLDNGRVCWIDHIQWRVFYKPLTNTLENKCK